MPKVLCTLPNASTLISGVAFTAHANGMLSEDVSDAVAADFAAVPGYEVVGAVDSVAEAAALAASEAEKAALLARADAIKLKTKGNWSIERLKAEVESAESAAEAAALAATVATPAATE